MSDAATAADGPPPATLPQPRLSLRVGITGHRLDKLSEDDLGSLREQLHDLLAELEAALARLHAAPAGEIYAREAPGCRLVSALAEGADRLAVEAAPPHWPLSAILPMPRDVYRRDFLPDGQEASASADEFAAHLARADTVTELPMAQAPAGAEPPPRSLQYAALARALVGQVDCLVAVWDGRPPKGPGGTGAVVAEAIDRGLAVIWLDHKGRTQPQQILRFRGGDLSRPVLGAIDAASLDRLTAQLFSLDLAAGGAPASLTQAWPRPSGWAQVYPKLLSWAGAGTPTGRSYAERRWPPPELLLADLEIALPDARPVLGDMWRVFAPRSYWADMLAWSHANLYRSAYVMAFLLAGLAVPIGLLATLADKTDHALAFKAVAVSVELAIVLFVAWIVMRGRKARWHAGWIEARELSELLRVSRPLLLVGRADDLFESASLRDRPLESFAVWYARATLREVRPVSGRLDDAHLTRVLGATRERIVAGQIAYHRANIEKLSRVDGFLHHLGDACFIATIVVLALYLVLFGLSWIVPAIGGFLTYLGKPVVSILAAGLPALGAALAGIRAQGEFSNRVRQSERTLASLTTIAEEIDGVLAEAPETALPEHVGNLVVATARVMMEDVRHWRRVHAGKTLALPS